MKQLITPTPWIPATGGWCLQYVRQAYGLPARYASATEAWEQSESKHRDRNFPPGLWTPVWYDIDIEPLGHVVLLAPDGRVYSTSDYSGWPVIHASLADLEAFYAYYGMKLIYRGWTEDVAGYAVMDNPITVQGTTQKELFTVGQYENIIRQIGIAHEKENNLTAGLRGFAEAVKGYQEQNQKWHGQSHAKQNAIKEVVDQIAKGQNVVIDWEKVEAAAKAGAAEALAEGVVSVDVNVFGKEAQQ